MVRRNKEKGQIVVFLFAGFLFFMVLLLVIMNSSILTAQKVKMQRVLDLATKQASQVQASQLNRIVDYNKDIEGLWNTLMFRINNPFDFYYLLGRCGGVAFCPPRKEKKCQDWDNTAREAIFGEFMVKRTKAATNIENIIKKTNEEAYNAALEILLAPKNIPIDLGEVLKKNYGGSIPSAQKLREIYSSQKFDFSGKGKPETIKERYDLNDGIKELWLFFYEHSKRPILYAKFNYLKTCAEGGLLAKPLYIFNGLGFDKKDFKPGIRYYKIKQTDKSYDTFFTSSLTYRPLYNLNFINIRKKTWDEGKPTKDLLFKNELTLEAVSMARPIGGDINDDNEFEDAELIGIADTDKKINFEAGRESKGILH